MAISVGGGTRAAIGMCRANAPRTKILDRWEGVGTAADALIAWSAPMCLCMTVAVQQLRSKGPTTDRLLYGTEPTGPHQQTTLESQITVNRHVPAYQGDRNEDLHN